MVATLTHAPPDAAALAGATRLLILQGTAFCNIDCDYCYLPHRSQRARMAHDTVAAAAGWIFRHRLAARGMTVVWHSGEPLVLPPEWYAESFARVAAAASANGVAPPGHGIQTNAMLINEAWCTLFRRHGVALGVSLDGPAALHDARRRTRTGGGTHAAAMRGIGLLQAHGIAFNTICVLTAAHLDQPEALIDFFADHSIQDLAFNVEEIEGVNAASSLAGAAQEAAFRRFQARALAHAARRGVRLRDLALVVANLRDTAFGTKRHNDQNGPFRIVSVGVDGALSTYSPELAGLSHPRLGDMTIGNVHHDDLATVLAGAAFRAQFAEVEAGIDACRALGCRYFDLCRGGAPSNKLAEHGSFAAAETLFCRLAQQATADAVLGALEAVLPRRVAVPG